MTTPELCICGQPIADCPHLTGFDSYAEKAQFYRAKPSRIAEVAKIDALGTRAGVKQALLIAQAAQAEAARLPLGEALRDALAIIGIALAKAALLAEMD